MLFFMQNIFCVQQCPSNRTMMYINYIVLSYINYIVLSYINYIVLSYINYIVLSYINYIVLLYIMIIYVNVGVEQSRIGMLKC
jgi:hypothetical protein